MQPKTVNIQCTGYAIMADWYQGNNDAVVLVLPGYSSTRKKQTRLADAIHSGTDSSVLVIEYSGHGDSPFELKDTCPAQHLLEVVCAFDYIKQQHPNAEIVVSGASYGGYLATLLAEYRLFEKLLLRAPAIYKPSTFYDLWAKRLAVVDEYTSDIMQYRHDRALLEQNPAFINARKFTGKSLVITHEKDDLVPVETTECYAQALSADTYLAKDLPHSLGQVPSEDLVAYSAFIVSWLNS